MRQYLYIVLLLLSVSSLFVPTRAQGATLEWDRNNEPDMGDYRVYACWTSGCLVTQTSSMLQIGTIPQTPLGIKPSVSFGIVNKEGRVAVSARDLNLNESGLSVSIPFDAVAPSIPNNLILK